jgi:hypothetical protein
VSGVLTRVFPSGDDHDDLREAVMIRENEVYWWRAVGLVRVMKITSDRDDGHGCGSALFA